MEITQIINNKSETWRELNRSRQIVAGKKELKFDWSVIIYILIDSTGTCMLIALIILLIALIIMLKVLVVLRIVVVLFLLTIFILQITLISLLIILVILRIV